MLGMKIESAGCLFTDEDQDEDEDEDFLPKPGTGSQIRWLSFRGTLLVNLHHSVLIFVIRYKSSFANTEAQTMELPKLENCAGLAVFYLSGQPNTRARASRPRMANRKNKRIDLSIRSCRSFRRRCKA